METRSESPFPTTTCDDDHCNETVPQSTRTNLCRSCNNFAQIFGQRPDETDELPTVELKRNFIFEEVSSWYLVLTVDGETDRRGPFHTEEKAQMLQREYQNAVRMAPIV